MRQSRGFDKRVRNRRYDALSRIDPDAFERLMGDHYRDQGFEVEVCGAGHTGSRYDGGIDLKLRKDGKYYVVQCKRNNVGQDTHKTVHELIGVMLTEGATNAIYVTTGEFTRYAREAASKHPSLQIIDGDEVRQLLGNRLQDLEAATAPKYSRPLAASTKHMEWNPVTHIAKARERRRPARDDVVTGLIVGVLALAAAVWFLGKLGRQLAPIRHVQPSATAPSLAVQEKPMLSAREPRSDSRLQTGDRPETYQPQPYPAPAGFNLSPPPPPVDALSERDRARQQVEVQRYLEKVPEITNYRYSPLPENRSATPGSSK